MEVVQIRALVRDALRDRPTTFRPYPHVIVRAARLKAARAKATHSIEQWIALIAEFGQRCVRCATPGKVTKDHIVPLFLGGSDGIDNLQPLCLMCNSTKGAETYNWVAHRRAHGFEQ